MSCGKCNAPLLGVAFVSREKPRNLAASVRQRLFNLAQERREDFGLVLTRYGLERFLYRLAQSQYRDQFILKGALLFELWTHRPYRPTRDLDRKSTRLNSSHSQISYAVFCLKKKKTPAQTARSGIPTDDTRHAYVCHYQTAVIGHAPYRSCSSSDGSTVSPRAVSHECRSASL